MYVFEEFYSTIIRIDLSPQPTMYQSIKKHKPVVEQYSQALIQSKVVTEQEYAVSKIQWVTYVCTYVHSLARQTLYQAPIVVWSHGV